MLGRKSCVDCARRIGVGCVTSIACVGCATVMARQQRPNPQHETKKHHPPPKTFNIIQKIHIHYHIAIRHNIVTSLYIVVGDHIQLCVISERKIILIIFDIGVRQKLSVFSINFIGCIQRNRKNRNVSYSQKTPLAPYIRLNTSYCQVQLGYAI